MNPTETEALATSYLSSSGIFNEHPFTLIDVGCSGGIDESWRAFGRSLRAFGIDPVLDEVEMLQANEKNPNVTYAAAYIGLPADSEIVRSRAGKGPWGRYPWKRLSTAWAIELLSGPKDDDGAKADLNRWPERRLTESERRISVDEFVAQREIDTVDAIKIDVDGEDLFALFSCGDVLESHGVLAVVIEVSFFGSDDETDNTFHNTDRYMRAKGFRLVDLSVRRYSCSALPSPFEINMPAQTTWGAPLQGDAVYVRDPVGDLGDEASDSLSVEKLLKLVAILELVGVPDCAAEVLTKFRNRFEGLVDIETVLDLLTPEMDGERMTYRDYLEKFSGDPTSFYPEARPHRSPAGALAPFVRLAKRLFRRSG